MQLEMWLTWIVGGGGAGAITYWFMERANPDLSSEGTRYASLVLAAVLGGLAFVASVGLGYIPKPPTGQVWIEQLFAVFAGIAFVSVNVSQALHGRNRLREKV